MRWLFLILSALGLCLSAFLKVQGAEDRQATLSMTPLETLRLSDHATSALLADGAYPLDAARIIFGRNPRHEAARLFLANEALQKGRPEEFVELYKGLFNTDRKNARRYAKHLAEVTVANELYDAVLPALDDEPYWGRDYLRFALAEPQTDIRPLLPAFRITPSAQGDYLRMLIQLRRWEEAYAAFQTFVSLPKDRDERLYDPELNKEDGPTPFNWQLSGTTDFRPGGGIEAFFNGRGTPTFMRQTLPLGEGEFLFTSEMSGYASEDVGRYEWVLRCDETGEVLMKAGPIQLSGAPQIFEHKVVADETCNFATLTLQGVAGRFPQSSDIRVQEVSLRLIDGEAAQ